ncbi:hypothetical protein C8J56DRAFT_1100961 [Mycena floridula]|nr:hypothetical protein C8J56DRAFT_1100961 [Mycena floridula]
MPASTTILYGRDLDLDFIVEQLVREPEMIEEKRARFALLGTGGMGKTALALKVMRDARVLAWYPEYEQVWFPCIQATSFPLFPGTIYSALDIKSNTKNTLNDILNELRSSKPLLLLFDNFETPWNIVGARTEVAQFLRDIDAIPHVALFITMRATVAPCEEITWTEMRIKSLDVEASCRLYTKIDPKARDDQKLLELLEVLGNMPLAVTLMARQGKSTGCTVKELMESYSKLGTAMLGPNKGSDSQNSMSISISMSLDSPQIKMEPNAAILLSRISLLPTGTSFQMLEKWWTPDIQNLQLHFRYYSKLLFWSAALIRSHVLDLVRFPNKALVSMIKAACRFLKKHDCVAPGRPIFKRDMAARSIEDINLQAILLQTSSPDPEFIEALCTLGWHQYQTRQYAEVIEHAVALADGTTGVLLARVLKCYGSILAVQGRFPRDSAIHKKDMAICLLNLGGACSRRGRHSEAIMHLMNAWSLLDDLNYDRATCAYILAQAHQRFGQYDEAEKWGLLALTERKSMGGGDITPVLHTLGKICISKGQYDLAIEHLREGLESAKATFTTAGVLVQLGRAQMKKGETGEARASFTKALALFERLPGRLEHLIICRYYLAKLDDPSRIPTPEELEAFRVVGSTEDTS